MATKAKLRRDWSVQISTFAQKTFNPIRSIVDGMKLTPNPEKEMIALSIGDPTIFGNLPFPEVAEQAVIKAVQDRKFNGYCPSVGYEKTRAAIAKYISTPTSEVTAKDVVLCSGCSGSLDLCITCLANPGDNILVPRPGFSIYKVLAESLGVEVRMYNLLPDQQWQVDLSHMSSLVDCRTATIVVNNPSNPCGCVYSKQHLEDILALAASFKVPIIADEIYEHFVFPGNEYHPMASLTTEVPILSCGGLTKRFLVPGWRLGWIVVHDRNGVFEQVRKGLTSLTQRILGPNTLVQAAVEDILLNTPATFYADTINYIKKNAECFYDELSKIPGLHPVMPQGAMYMMVGVDIPQFPDFKNDVEFTERLVTEQSVFCLPATAFQYPNYFRVVLTVPSEKVVEACERIRQFCQDHFHPRNSTNGV